MPVGKDDKELDGPEENQNSKPEQLTQSIEEIKAEILAQVRAEVAKAAPQLVSGSPDMVGAIQGIVDGLSKQSDAEIYGSGTDYVDESKLDPDDVLPEGYEESFYSHDTGYVIVDDLRNGRPVRTPFGGVIEFKYQATRTVGTGKEVDLYNFSLYTCRSRKEAAWMKAHSYFGVKFFSKAESALGVDARKAARISKLMNNLRNQGQAQVVNMCKQHGIGLMDSVQDMRIAIASKIAEEEMSKEKATEASAITATRQAQELLGRNE